LDLCCLNRPFDDQTQPRVNVEAQAVVLIFQGLQSRGHQLCTSTALAVENARNPNVDHRRRVKALLDQAEVSIPHGKALDARVLELKKFGFREFDAYHVGSAEAGACDRLVTCDDQFLKAARRSSATINVMVTDPISLVSEVDF
jgi:hypothetical protein